MLACISSMLWICERVSASPDVSSASSRGTILYVVLSSGGRGRHVDGGSLESPGARPAAGGAGEGEEPRREGRIAVVEDLSKNRASPGASADFARSPTSRRSRPGEAASPVTVVTSKPSPRTARVPAHVREDGA